MSSPVRVTAVTVAAIFLLGGVSGCAKDETSTPAEPTTAAPSATVGSQDPAGSIAGTWRSEAADWTVHFADDGTFVEDFEGNKEFRRGTYSVEGAVVQLEGDDGNGSSGDLSGDTIVFKLGTLERQ